MEDMLRMFIMQQPQRWEDYLHLVEFTYNNEHHGSLGMSPFEVLYGRKCRVPTDWNSLGNKLALGPDMLAEMEAIAMKVRHNLKVVQDRKKVYADNKRTHKEFQLGDHVYLKVKPQNITCNGKVVQNWHRGTVDLFKLWNGLGPWHIN